MPFTPEIEKLRKFIWNCLFDLYQIEGLQGIILSILYDYQHLLYSHKGKNEHIKTDAEEIIGFFESHFSPENFYHCLIVQKFYFWLDEYKIDFDTNIKAKFNTSLYQIYALLKLDYFDAKDDGIDYNNFEEYKKFAKKKLNKK